MRNLSAAGARRARCSRLLPGFGVPVLFSVSDMPWDRCLFKETDLKYYQFHFCVSRHWTDGPLRGSHGRDLMDMTGGNANLTLDINTSSAANTYGEFAATAWR
jgi:hypothetical protein